MKRILSAAMAIAVLAGGAWAQEDTRGRVRGQTEDLGRQAAPAPSRAPEIFVDYREEMRLLIEQISSYARSFDRNFVIVVEDGLDLLVKPTAGDETLTVPARNYIRAIDGVLVDGLFYGWPDLDQPVDEKRQERLMPLLKVAKDQGLEVLVLDHGVEPETVRAVRAASRKAGFTAATVPAHGHDINALPRYPRRPFDENAKNVLSLAGVRNFAYLRNSAGYGREDEFALAMHGTNYDMLVVDVMHGRRPLTTRAVETLKHKKLGARRLVLAYMNVGAAESHQFYWKRGWREGSPRWIVAPVPTAPDSYFVEYWRPEWQQFITGSTNSYTYGAFAQGYDGILIDGADTYRYFETGGIIAEEDR